MNNVRKDGTVLNKMDRTQWERETIEASRMTDQDISKQNELLEYWQKVSKNPKLRESEIKELELQRRISAATEGDDSASRTATRILEHKAEVKLDEWHRKQFKQEDEEQFTEELREQGEKYSDAVKRARKSVGL
ncbi:MAG: hypothetical protein AAB492_03050 [Patescibacteria group bacterium]